MDRRTIMGLLAAMVAVQVYFYVFMKPAAPVDSDAGGTTTPAADGAPVVTAPGEPTPAPVADEPARLLPRSWCAVNATITTDGGAFRGATSTDHTADYHTTPWWTWIYGRATGTISGPWQPYTDNGDAQLLTADADALVISSGDLAGPAPRVTVTEETESTLVLSSSTADGVEIVRRLATTSDPCMLDATVSWTNKGTAPWAGPAWVAVFDRVPETYGRYVSSARPVGSIAGKVTRWTALTALDAPQTYGPGDVEWFGLHDKFFAFAVLPDHGHDSSLVYGKRKDPLGPKYGVWWTEDLALAPGVAETRHFKVYVGATELETLKAADPALGSIVDLGWFGFFGRAMLWVLMKVHGLVGGWGLAIVAVTVILKVVTLPLTQMAFKSSQAMQAAQPELQKVREEFADNPEELNRQTMAVMSKHGANPATGCLPMLIQLPIWMALGSVLSSCVELYHAHFLWLRDLSSPDPYGILPVVVMCVSMLQQRAMPVTGMDPDQARMMKALPIVFGIMYFWFPSGLVLYIFVNMVLTMAQQWVVKRQFGGPTPPAI